MERLNDHIDPATLDQLQQAFTRVTGLTVRICDRNDDGGELAASRVGLPVIRNGQVLGRLVLETPGGTAPPPQAEMLLQLLGESLKLLCAKQQQLTARVEELATLYRLTAMFSAYQDLLDLLNTVVRTVVEFMGVKACSLRLLDPETDELTIAAVANLSADYLGKGKVLLRDSILDTEAMTHGRIVYVEDERTDPRVLFPQQVRREGIVSALIVPIRYKWLSLGALRVYTGEVYRFSDYEIALVRAIADQAAAAIVNARLHEDRMAAEAMRRQIRLAGEVQRRMVPAEPPRYPGVDIGAAYVPSLELSGDFYDFIALPNGNLGVALCDVMGKGVPAALMTASLRASLRAHADDLYDLGDILQRVNRGLCNDTLDESFATLFYGVLNTARMELTYGNAGHEPPVLLRDGTATPLTGGGLVLGIDRDQVYGKSIVQLKRGDVLFCATDGLIEAMNFREEQFGRQRTCQSALTAIANGADANSICRHVLWEMRRFAGLHERGDDVTLLAVRIV
ncbi:MAG: PP2C family protein-serine/threonine phosphatase [Planctomycetes bacterium]|nr:PP2C family protein-serine/threonine phosphatase [Planctomycetota bacterium]